MVQPAIVAAFAPNETPEKIQLLMKDVGALIAARGWWLRSGHGQAGDYAFEQGAQNRSIIYLPFQEWGLDRGEYLSSFFVYYDSLKARDYSLWQEAKAAVQYYHHAYKLLSEEEEAAIACVYLCLLGQGSSRTKKPTPANVLLCWTKKKESKKKKTDLIDEEGIEEIEIEEEEDNEKDGLVDADTTHIAIKIAKDYDIPIIDLGKVYFSKMDAENVIENIRQFMETRDKEDDIPDAVLDDDEIAKEAEDLTDYLIRELEKAREAVPA